MSASSFVVISALAALAVLLAVLPPTAHATPPAPAGPAGSVLWGGRLFQDPVARGLGDIVTVLVLESASATGEVTTETRREESMEGGPGTASFDFIPGWGVKGKNDQKGQGTAGRKANLVAKIPARVVEVLPDGTLRLEGTREVEMNGEREVLALSGLVRPMDIGADNTVVSSVMADARIQYHGRGPITNGQRISRFMRLINWIF